MHPPLMRSKVALFPLASRERGLCAPRELIFDRYIMMERMLNVHNFLKILFDRVNCSKSSTDGENALVRV